MKKLDKHPNGWNAKTETTVVGKFNNIVIYDLKREHSHNLRIRSFSINGKKLIYEFITIDVNQNILDDFINNKLTIYDILKNNSIYSTDIFYDGNIESNDYEISFDELTQLDCIKNILTLTYNELTKHETT